MDVKPKVLNESRDVRLVQNLSIGEEDFNQFFRLRNQLVVAAENFGTEENLFSALMPTISNDMGEQLKPAEKLIDVVDRKHRRVCGFLPPYNVEKPMGLSAQVLIFGKKKEDEIAQQYFYVNC